jgi:hypothetical protein
MKLSDVMSAMNLSVYAEVGLILFALAFGLVVLDLLRQGPKLERFAQLPLESDARPAAEALEKNS